MNNNRVLKIVLNVVTYVFVALCVIMVIFAVVGNKSPDGAVDVFGYQARIVLSESMAKCDETDVSGYQIKDIPLRSMVFVETVPEDESQENEWYKALKVGDVLTFRYQYDTQKTITHRIISIKENLDDEGNLTGGYTIELKGDNVGLAKDPNASEMDVNSQVINTDNDGVNYVIGKVVRKSVIFGTIVYAITKPVGMALIVMVPSAIIMFLEIIKIINVLKEDKEKKAEEEKQEQLSEIEELKKQLEELKKTTSQQQNDSEE